MSDSKEESKESSQVILQDLATRNSSMPRIRIGKYRKTSRPAASAEAPPPMATPARPAAKKPQSSPRGVMDRNNDSDDELDEVLSYSSAEGSYTTSESSYDDDDDESAYDETPAEALVDMMKDVFVGSDNSDEDGDSTDNETTREKAPADALADMMKGVFAGSKQNHDNVDSDQDDDDDEDSTDRANKICMRLELNDATLKEVDLDCDSIEKDTAKEMAELLKDNTRLKTLSLVCNGEKKSRNNFRILFSALAKNSSVEVLGIQHAALDREAASCMGTTLALNQSVTKVCLKDCTFVGSGLTVLFMGMQHNSRIQELVMSSCDLAGSNSDIVSASLPLMSLTSLTLIDTNLKTDEDLSFLFDSIKKTPSLLQLNLSHNELGRQGMELLADCFRSPHKDQKLNKLVLSHCSLDEYCISRLARALKQNSSLASLDLSGNDFGDAGARTLKVLLERNSSIKELRVDNCGISRRWIKHIEDGQRYNSSFLKTFGFSATTSLAILETVDAVEQIGGEIGTSVSDVIKAS